MREYDPILGRWLQVDPVGQYFSPYIGMGNDPVNRIDPDGGFDDYQLKEDGSINLIRKTNDKFDVLYDKNCNIIDDNIAKGILYDGINFQDHANYISRGLEVEALDMLRKLSVSVEKEISGYGFYDSDGKNAGLVVESYRNHTWFGGKSKVLLAGEYYTFKKLGEVTPAFHFHTHPGHLMQFAGRIGSDPYPSDHNSKLPPGADHDENHFYKTGNLPHVILGGINNGTVLMTGDGNGGYKSKLFK